MIIIIFLLLFCIFSITDSKIHKKYLGKENEIEKKQGAEEKTDLINCSKMPYYLMWKKEQLY